MTRFTLLFLALAPLLACRGSPKPLGSGAGQEDPLWSLKAFNTIHESLLTQCLPLGLRVRYEGALGRCETVGLQAASQPTLWTVGTPSTPGVPGGELVLEFEALLDDSTSSVAITIGGRPVYLRARYIAGDRDLDTTVPQLKATTRKFLSALDTKPD